MNSPIQRLNIKSASAAKLLMLTALMVTSSTSYAEDADLAYVDSIHEWGAWNLDIEPAAGGLSQPTTPALNARGSKVALRTNSIAALAPPKVPVVFTAPTAPLVPPVVPVTPPTPPVTPPIGGPTDGLF